MHLFAKSVRLAKRRRWTIYGVGGGLWLTGVLWLIFHYFAGRQSAFGPTPHPLEHWWLSLHGLFAFATLWVLGQLWVPHIVRGWGSGRHRITGSLLFALLGSLVITGYLLYYPPSEAWLPTLAWVHWGVGLGLIIPFVVHRYWRQLAGESR